MTGQKRKGRQMADNYNLPAIPSVLDEVQKLTPTQKKLFLCKKPKNGTDLVKQALITATDPGFMTKFDKEVGNPRPNETKDEYVERGRNVVINLLKKIFGE